MLPRCASRRLDSFVCYWSCRRWATGESNYQLMRGPHVSIGLLQGMISVSMRSKVSSCQGSYAQSGEFRVSGNGPDEVVPGSLARCLHKKMPQFHLLNGPLSCRDEALFMQPSHPAEQTFRCDVLFCLSLQPTDAWQCCTSTVSAHRAQHTLHTLSREATSTETAYLGVGLWQGM